MKNTRILRKLLQDYEDTKEVILGAGALWANAIAQKCFLNRQCIKGVVI